MKSRSPGFTLIEMAVAVFIIALLLGSILVPLSKQSEQTQIRESEKMLKDAREALLGFAAVNGYLPCPDRTAGPGSNDGIEDVTAGACTVTVGNLPVATLGLDKHSDPWGNRLRYGVDADYGRRAAPLPSLLSLADVRVCTVSTCATKATILTDFDPAFPVPGNEAVAVVLSHGPNGYGAISFNTSAANTAPTDINEIANTVGAPFVHRTSSAVGSSAGEFDDIVIWFGKSTLFKGMIAAGKLP